MWLLLFFESSVTPGLTGLMISCIPDNYKELGNSITQLCYNLIGFLPSPFIYGLVSSYTGGEDNKWGLSVIILWSLFGFISLLFAKNIFLRNEINEIYGNKESYLDAINDPKNSNNNEIFIENENIEYKRSHTFNSNFSTEILNEIDKSPEIIVNKVSCNHLDNLREKSNIITNLYGGISQV